MKRRNLLLVVAILVMGALPVLAKTRVGDIVARIKGNVTGSGVQTVGLKAVSVKGEPDDPFVKAVVVVMNAQGATLATSQRSFDIGPAGVAELQVAGDVDGDGKGEVIVQEPQSDVRPQHFAVLRFGGNRLAFVRSQTLMETAPNSGRFTWKANGGNGRWIGKFKRIVSPGVCEVEVWDGQSEGKRMTVKATADGYSAR